MAEKQREEQILDTSLRWIKFRCSHQNQNKWAYFALKVIEPKMQPLAYNCAFSSVFRLE